VVRENLMKNIIAPMLLGMSLVGCGASTPIKQGDDGLALRKSEPIQIYMGACVASRASASGVKSQAKKMGFTPLSGQGAQQYLSGNSGLAWKKTSGNDNYGLALLGNGLCSVFIHQGSPETLQASMEAWLPPANSGFTYDKKIISSRGHLTTTQYQIFRSGVLEEQWVITTNSQPNSELVAVMSYDG